MALAALAALEGTKSRQCTMGKKGSKIGKILGNQYEITTVSKFIFLGMFWLKSLNLATIWLILPKIIDKCEKSCII